MGTRALQRLRGRRPAQARERRSRRLAAGGGAGVPGGGARGSVRGPLRSGRNYRHEARRALVFEVVRHHPRRDDHAPGRQAATEDAQRLWAQVRSPEERQGAHDPSACSHRGGPQSPQGAPGRGKAEGRLSTRMEGWCLQQRSVRRWSLPT